MQQRKPIDIKNCKEVGFVKKPHGIKGDLLVVFEKGIDESVEELDYLFFEIDGLLVPYFIEEMAWRDDETIIFKFNLINSKEKAQLFVGYKIYVDIEDLFFDNSDYKPHLLKGFKIIDQNLGPIGKITEVNDFGGNIVFSVNYNGNEVMIPFNEDLLISFDQEIATMVMDCPEGLFNLTD